MTSHRVHRAKIRFGESGKMKTHIKKSFVLRVLVAVVAVLVAYQSQAQFTYTTNNGTITITGYTGTNHDVVIPRMIDGLPVTGIGTNAFYDARINTVTVPNTVTNIGDFAFEFCTMTNVTIPNSVTSIGFFAFGFCTSLTNVTIPNGVTSIGNSTFWECTSLTSVTIPNGVTSIGNGTFSDCRSLTSVTIPKSVTNIGNGTFFDCTSLTSVTIPNSVTNIGDVVFSECWGLTKVFFDGNAPAIGQDVFDAVRFEGPPGTFDPATVYFLPRTTGWTTNFAGLPTAIWTPEVQAADGGFGVKSNQFGFNVTWADGMSLVVEASTSLSNPVWSHVVTNTLSGGTFYFTDPQWTNYPSRFYRVRSQ